MSESQSPAPFPSNVEPKQTSTQRKLVLSRDEFQAVLAAAYLLQEHRDRLHEKERGVLVNSLERAQSIEEAPLTTETTAPFTEGAGLDQLQSKVAQAAILERERISQKQVFRTAMLGSALLVAIVALGASLHRFSPLGRLARDGRFHAVSGKQANVVTATKMVSKIEDRIRADRRLQRTPVHVSESGGIITLSGDVNSGAQRAAAVEDAQIKGVKVVVDNLRVINPNDQPAAAVQGSVGSSALQSKAPSEAFPVVVPAHRVHPPAVNKTIPPPRPTNAASQRNAAPVMSVSPKSHVPNSDVSAGNASALEAAPAVAPSIRIREQVTVPEGTVLAVQLTESLSSDRNETGDIFHARLASPIVVGNKVVIPAGAIVDGRIVNARNAGHFYGDSALAVKVTRLAYNGKTYELRSSPYLKQGGSQTRRVAATLGTGAGVGAILGAIVGGGKGAVIGAAIGAGAGSGIQAMSKAAQVQLPAKSMLRFRLETPLTVIPS
jgi:BON domain